MLLQEHGQFYCPGRDGHTAVKGRTIRKMIFFLAGRGEGGRTFQLAGIFFTPIASAEKFFGVKYPALLFFGGGGGLRYSTVAILGRVRLGSIRTKNNWNNANKRLFGSYSHSGITGFPFWLLCSQEQNSWNIFRIIFLFRNIPNERALNLDTRPNN